jgi:hypothetical protein
MRGATWRRSATASPTPWRRFKEHVGDVDISPTGLRMDQLGATWERRRHQRDLEQRAKDRNSHFRSLNKNWGLPVLTANQVAFSHAQRVADSRASVIGYGRIFDLAEVTFQR